MQGELLSDLFALEKLTCFMKEKSSIKEYFQYIKEWSFINGISCDLSEEKVKKINYIYNRNGIDYVETKNNIDTVQELETWLKTFRNNNKRVSIKVFYANTQKEIEENKIRAYGEIISQKFKGYNILVHYEHYIENLLLDNGLLEKRNINFFFLIIKKDGKKIDVLLYNEVPDLEIVVAQMDEVIKKYNMWCTLPLGTLNIMKNQEIKVLTTPEAATRIFHEAIGHFAEKDIYKRIGSNRIELYEKIGCEQLNVIDIPQNEKINTNIIFDDTGITAKETTIISDGILVGIMDDGFANRKGYYENGFLRNSIDFEQLQIRMRNLVVKNGTYKFLDIFNNLDSGLLIEKISNSYRMEDSIYLQVERGTLIRKGKKTTRIENVLLQNTTYEFFESLESICDNGEWDRLKKCRKNGGSIYISTYAPSILCKMKSTN